MHLLIASSERDYLCLLWIDAILVTPPTMYHDLLEEKFADLVPEFHLVTEYRYLTTRVAETCTLVKGSMPTRLYLLFGIPVIVQNQSSLEVLSSNNYVELSNLGTK